MGTKHLYWILNSPSCAAWEWNSGCSFVLGPIVTLVDLLLQIFLHTLDEKGALTMLVLAVVPLWYRVHFYDRIIRPCPFF